MLERLKSIHYMFWASLIFMLFPILPVVTGWLSAWHLLIDILFVVAYLGVLTTKSRRLSWLYWGLMLTYVVGNTAFVAFNYIWRIGQDLHDSLGHTFAMLSVKTDLALQLFQMEAYPQVEKELKEIHRISKDSMNEVRTIVENLKSRTLTSELETVKKMLEIAGIEVEIANQLDTASLTQELESTASMILLELVTNIIKHAKASNVYLKLERTEKELILTVGDDGCGFASIKGDDLHTVRDRVLPFSGEVKVISWKQPTEVQVRLPYKERN
ncbi:histidine kinase [Streptococcus pneumoniae]|nr:histidine kinase [Streptococcus pneumoniae]VNE61041.1 histidine kinase [Streptococcus pneumoniae]